MWACPAHTLVYVGLAGPDPADSYFPRGIAAAAYATNVPPARLLNAAVAVLKLDEE